MTSLMIHSIILTEVSSVPKVQKRMENSKRQNLCSRQLSTDSGPKIGYKREPESDDIDNIYAVKERKEVREIEACY